MDEENLSTQPDLTQPDLAALVHFSVDSSGIILLKFANPDLAMQFYPGETHHESLLQWCQARKRQNGGVVYDAW